MDQTERTRRGLVRQINVEPGSRLALEIQHGQVWNTQELCRDFEATGFAAPFVIVKRRSDGELGSLIFQHHPRFYCDFKENE